MWLLVAWLFLAAKPRASVTTGRLNQEQPAETEDGVIHLGTGALQGGMAALSKSRLSEQSQLEQVGAGYTFFWGGRSKAERRDAGVDFVIRNDIVGRLPCLAPYEPPPASSGRQVHQHHQCLRSPNDEL
ncbi:unnamed protein product [Schistocephalus solidus]|uniref:Secreted protein n=1 Tax=Schistocephalus solidus TaxID=70667 RepID=A0A183T1Z8_SCHSO|nr:unnamed protein product [Schistocephalus solidus]